LRLARRLLRASYNRSGMMDHAVNSLSHAHDWRLVALAGLVCVLGSLTAISLFHRACVLEGRTRLVWLLIAGVATGCGVWATHFIAMLAIEPGFSISYDPYRTMLSLVVGIAASALGLAFAIYGRMPWHAGFGGAVIGLGGAALHFIGMAGMQMPAHIVWSPELIAAAVALGTFFGAAALATAARSESLSDFAGAVLLLAIAILSLHFTAMGAADIVHDKTFRLLGAASMSDEWMGVALAAVVGSMLATCLIGSFSDRSVRRKLDAQNLRLDSALNNMNQGLCMFDGEHRLVVWNQRYVDMYGIDPNRIWPACTIRDLLDARIAAGTFPLDPERYDADLRAALKEGKSFTMTVELPDGRIIAVVNQPSVHGGWVATHEDITERQRAERNLEHTRAFLDTIIENVPSPILVKGGPRLEYVYVNRAAEAYLGIARDAMLGKSVYDVLPPASAELIDDEDRKVLASGEAVFTDEHTVVTPGNGTRITTENRLAVAASDGQPQYVIVVVNDLTERKRTEQRIAHMAHHDPLTDLPNRAAFNECIAATIDLAAVGSDGFAVLSFDIDRFKAVNDVFGHHVGDVLLREAAQRLEAACEGAFLARTGGDEFIAISPSGPQPVTGAALAARLQEALVPEIEIEGRLLKVGLTIGVALYPQDGADAATLVANANAALFRAKAEARGAVRFFDRTMDNHLRDQRALQQDLISAISREELTLHYQPQARIDGTITGFEALARWQHPRYGMVPPSTFIPLAEESGHIIALGEWALRTACREAASWPMPLTVAINLSPVQFRITDLPKLVHEVLLETGLSPERLELEITEGVLIGDFTRAVSTLRRLKGLGVRIAMDDFGTGYSSLSYLQSFPFDKIKIDKAFIANVTDSEQSATIVRAVIALGRGLGLPVMAEGVETEEQLKFLAEELCDEVQGYYIGRPKPIADYAELVGRVAFGRKDKSKKKPRIAIAG
jgi:diguanylate cyclase (GGDEF)-like protein/PAS domain S-box-containing protein